MKHRSNTVILRALTWSRDSHGLFDFESKHINKQYLTVDRPCSIERVDNDVRLITDSSKSPQLSSNLCQISFQPGLSSFSVSPVDTEDMWLVVRTVLREDGKRGYTLNEGDILKLGRIKFKVKELVTNTSPAKEKIEFEEYRQDDIDTEITETKMCRICLCDSSESENPLVSPCSCAGTMKYIHIQCLKRWIGSRLIVKENECNISYDWKAMTCELCKHTLPKQIAVKEHRFELFEFEKPRAPYLVLESLSRDRSSTGLQIISMHDKKDIRIGRGHESDIRISDISVSRLHAYIHYRDGKFILEDNESKFGTLVQMNSSMSVCDSRQLSVQVGRTVLTMGIRSHAEALISTGLLEGISKGHLKEVFKNVMYRTMN